MINTLHNLKKKSKFKHFGLNFTSNLFHGLIVDNYNNF